MYLNPHRIFRQPSLIWRLAQDLIEVLPDADRGEHRSRGRSGDGRRAARAHDGGLLDGRREPDASADSFAPLSLDGERQLMLRSVLSARRGGPRVLLADDVRNTGETFARAKAAIEEAGGTVIGTRCRSAIASKPSVDIGVPNFALTEYRAPENYPGGNCPLCKAGTPVTRF